MTWTMADLLGAKAVVVVKECSTGKTMYATKVAAQQALAQLPAERERTHQHAYRCQFCERYHFGHRRGGR